MMRKALLTMFPVLLFGLLGGPASAEDELVNKVTAYVQPGSSDSAVVVDLWMSNVNPIIGLTLPFKFAARTDTLIFDSISFDQGRASLFFAMDPIFRPSNNTLLVQMLWRMDTTAAAPPIPPGEGPLAKIWLRAQEKISLEQFKIASVQIPPNNVLMYVAQTLNRVNPSFEFKAGPPPAMTKESAPGSDTKGKSK
jgi:hypothetical protein